MKEIFLKQLKSGNFKIVKDTIDFDLYFTTVNGFVDFYNKNINGYHIGNRSYGSRIIKATYRKSQTYYNSPFEVLKNTQK